jgi:ribosomal protein L14E/L6E/L27E
VSHTSFSLIEDPFLVEPVESDKNKLIHLSPISPILAKSAGLSISGVKSILKSQV